MSAQFNSFDLWQEYAIKRKYEIESDGSGHKLIAHVNGNEKGAWDSKYGGAGFGWFY